MRRAIIVTVIGLLLAGGYWWIRHPAHPPRVNAALYENDMTEGLIRSILRELAPPVPSVCFLAFGEGSTPPSRTFLSRFAGTHPALRSRDEAVSPPIGKYFETSTGKMGLVIHIVKFKALSSDRYDVLVAFSNLPAGHDHFTYTMHRKSDREWIAQGRKPY